MLNFEKKILECLEKHPGASAQRVLRFLNVSNSDTASIEETKRKSVIFKKLRTLKRDRKVVNKGNTWYLVK